MSKQPERRRRLVRAFAPAVGLLAAGLLVWQGSYAAFSATTNANSNHWTTGNLALQNDTGGGFNVTTTADFGTKNMKPGDSGEKCLTVEDTGSLSGQLRMYISSITENDSNNPVAPVLDVTVKAAPTTTDVTDCTKFPTTSTTIYNGVALSALPTTYATATAGDTVAGSGMEAYDITWTLSTSAGNNLMSQGVTADITWEIQ